MFHRSTYDYVKASRLFLKFIIKEQEKDQIFSLIYRTEDFSFDIEPLIGSGHASIMINDLQLEIDHDFKSPTYKRKIKERLDSYIKYY